MTISAAMSFAEWGKTKINLIDTPGFNMFTHEAEMVLPAVEAALVVVDAVSGVQVVTEKIWGFAEKYSLPRVLVCTRMDRERADFQRCMESLTTTFGRTVIPVQLPIGSEKNFSGVIDLVRMKAYTYEVGGNGKAKVGEIPANLAGEAKEAHERLVELVAEGDDTLMEEFFSSGTLAEDRLLPDSTTRFAATRSFPCYSPRDWAILAPTRCSISWSITRLRPRNAERCKPRPDRETASPRNARLPTPNRSRSTSSKP